jgi:MFS family permease
LGSLYYIVLVTVLGHIAYSGSRMTVSLFAINLHATPLTVGMLMGLYALLPALLSIQAGRVADRVGVRMPMIAGAVLGTIGCLVPFVWPNVVALHMASALIGTGFMVVGVCVYQVVGDVSTPENRPTCFSVLALGFSVGGFCGPMLAGYSIDHFGHRMTFLILAALAICPAIAMAVKPVVLPKREHHIERPTDAALMDLFRNRDLRRIYISVALFSVAWDVYNFAIPIYGVRIGLAASQIGLIMGAFAAATFVVRLAMPWIAKHVKPWPLIMASALISATSFFLVPFVSSVASLMALLFVLGLGLGSPQPMVLSLLHEAAPPGRGGEAVGVRILLINMSQTIMPLLFGAVGTLGMLPVFWSTAFCLTAGGWLARRRALAKSEPIT